MVDFGFVKRDRAGTRYFLNFPKVEATLSPAAIASARMLVKDALARRTKRRRKRPDSNKPKS